MLAVVVSLEARACVWPTVSAMSSEEHSRHRTEPAVYPRRWCDSTLDGIDIVWIDHVKISLIGRQMFVSNESSQ